MKVDFRLTLMHSIRSVWRKNKIEGSTDIYPLTLLCMWIAAYNWWNEKHEYAVSENLESEKDTKIEELSNTISAKETEIGDLEDRIDELENNIIEIQEQL